MFERLIFEWRLRRLLKRRKRLTVIFDEAFKKAKAEGKKSDDLDSAYFFEIDMLEDEVSDLQYEHLRARAQSLLVPLPPFSTTNDSKWERSNLTGKWKLTRPAMLQLTVSVREADRDRWETFTRWVPIGSAIISAALGVLSLVVAILALKLKH